MLNNTLKNINETENGFEFLLTHLSDYLPYLMLHVLGCLLGILGSIAIILAILVTKELHTSTYKIIANIALANFILSSIVDTLTIAGIIIIIIIIVILIHSNMNIFYYFITIKVYSKERNCMNI
jgi:hypothetical protein